MNAFRLQDPVWLLLAIPVVLVVWHDLRRQRRSAVLFSSVHILKTLPRTLALRFRRVMPWVLLAGLLLVAIALARPQRGLDEYRIHAEGIAIQMVCDCSGSMRALDFTEGDEPETRLSVVKRVFRDFVSGKGDLPGRPDDLIGLIAFGGYPDSKCPLTLDHGALLEILESVSIPKEIWNERGEVINGEEFQTAIGDALALGVDRLKDVKAKSKVMILLSDGMNTAGAVVPLSAAEAAAAFDVKIYTVGIGSTGIVPVAYTDRFGQVRYGRERVYLDEDLLTSIAGKTDGRYFNARDRSSLEQVYAEIDTLEKTETEGVLYTEHRELYGFFLFPGIGLLVLHLILACTRFRSLP